ncbi:MAG: response regulator [Ignavibacteriae bacterium]|jgi:CheY-like chemotaxis protein|nr:response regulator [Ignavibacteriota bacterium]NOG97178.1 response regulator [Ignavibacteriota bacterium]
MSGKIIIVEDDPFSQEFYLLLFDKRGYNPIIEEDGDKLFKEIEDGNVDLIIMDINLRNTYFKGDKIDGVKLSSIIKQNPKFSHIPILLITAYSDSIVENKYFEESLADDYIIKPITDFNKLLNKVEGLIKR